MKITLYNKLVRDKIPEIIKKSGHKPIVYTADDEEYIKRLYDKLTLYVGLFFELLSIVITQFFTPIEAGLKRTTKSADEFGDKVNGNEGHDTGIKSVVLLNVTDETSRANAPIFVNVIVVSCVIALQFEAG